MDLKKLIERRNQCVAEAEAIRSKYNGVDTEMPSDEQERWEKAIGDAEELDNQIDLCSREEKLRKAGEKLNLDLPALVKAGSGGEEPDGEFDLEKALAGMSGTAQFRPSTTELSRAVKKYIAQGGKSEKELSAMSVSDPTGGGYTVGMEIYAGVIEIIRDLVYMRSISTVHTLTNADSLGIPTFDTELSDSDWTSEIGTGSEETVLPFARRELKPIPLAKLVKVSRTLLRLSPMAADVVLSRLAYKRAVAEEKGFLVGTGSNQPLGVFTAAASGISTGRDVAGATANTVVPDDFWKVLGSLKKGYQNKAQWIIGRGMETRVRMLKDAANNYIWQPGFYPSQYLVGAMPSTICGRPYSVSENAPAQASSGSLTTGTYAAIAGDFSMYHIADALTVTVQRLEELFGLTNQVGFILRSETDGMPIHEEAFARLAVS